MGQECTRSAWIGGPNELEGALRAEERKSDGV